MMQSVYGDDDEHHDDEDDHYNDTHTDSSWLGRLLYMDVQRACMGIWTDNSYLIPSVIRRSKVTPSIFTSEPVCLLSLLSFFSSVSTHEDVYWT